MGPPDRDWLAARDPNASPQLLANIAARRWDLHALIAQHPRAHPQLRQWIATVNPNSVRPQPRFQQPPPPGAQQPQRPQPRFQQPPPPGTQQPQRHFAPGPGPRAPGPYPQPAYRPPPRRSGGGWGWLIGVGSVALIGSLLFIAAFLGGALVPSDPKMPPAQTPLASRQGPLPSRQVPLPSPRAPLPSRQLPPPSTAPQPTVPTPSVDPAAKYRTAFNKDRDRFNQLNAALKGNPVAPLVTDVKRFRYLEQYMSQPGVTEANARKVAQEARSQVQSLDKSIAAAKKRRGNASGTAVERFVDESGNGFIALSWDATSACQYKNKRAGSTVGGCVKGGEAKIHLRKRDGTFGQWAQRMIVVHEMAHVYQNVDRERNWPQSSYTDKLLKQGLFRGSHESMADCYALEYLDERDLSNGRAWVGYGYVCSSSERKAIRKWARDVGVPMAK